MSNEDRKHNGWANYEIVLVRNRDGRPDLWIDIVVRHLISEDGTRYYDYAGSTLNDANTSTPYDPTTESNEDTAADWLARRVLP